MVKERKLTRAEQKAQRPLQILDAAFEEFVKNGYAATRVEDIAERVGVTKGTVYVYFETKELLFESMIRHVSRPFGEIATNAETLVGSPPEKLTALLRMVYEQLFDDRQTREVMRLVISEGPKFPDIVERHERDFVNPVIASVEAILAEGVGLGQFHPGPAGFAELMVAPIVTVTVMRLIFGDRREVDKEAYIKAHMELLLHGLHRSAVETA
ncbi:TetR/AcrR family transcriptional regulator [Neorhizobium lilium]|uniref:TetR/AcrR family transcriptional regulator n=1 Tax=Neorhizobium lilium TaxID=2503024 RepID=A0A444LI94_9HYPH|nr:TetR/AcrR family transcriptional regulator [Neorhizobium lilium]RWX78770.1 TetR/AcrR family transcriptional regulator [Neorhizobium lilium]